MITDVSRRAIVVRDHGGIHAKMAMNIRDAYISVEIKDSALQHLREGLKKSLDSIGIECEIASHDAHVSIAYGDGDVALSELEEAAREITCRPFTADVDGFDILHGLTTPFDYLVIKLKGDGAFENAVRCASEHMTTKSFAGGFHTHVSLLRFPKGELDTWAARELVSDMNAAQQGAFALGCRPCLKGNSVSVYDPDRRRRLNVPFESMAPLAL